LRDEIEEIAESEIDTLGGLEIPRVFEESGLKSFFMGSLGNGSLSQKGLGLAGAKDAVEGLMRRKFPLSEEIDGRT